MPSTLWLVPRSEGMNARELIKARYARVRASIVANDGFVDHFPPLEEVDEEEWDRDEAYFIKQCKGLSFTYTRVATKRGPEEDVNIGTVDYWREILTDPSCTVEKEDRLEEIRPATDAEVVDFVMNGGIEAADQDDAEFQQGWDSYNG